MNTAKPFARAMRFALVALSLLGWQLSVALAGYDARKSEAMAELEKVHLSAEERTVLKDTLGSYFDAREDCLEALVEIIKKQDKNEQDALFAGRAAACGGTGSKILFDGIGKIKDPSVGALGFVNVFAMNESAFFQGLLQLTVAERRDRIVAVETHLLEKSAVLREKWSGIIVQDSALDGRAEEISNELRADLKIALSEVAKAHSDAAELLAEGVKQWAQATTAPNFRTGDETIDQLLGAIKFLLGPTIGVLQSRSTRWLDRARKYEALFYSERRVLVMFEEVRKDVRDFLRDNDISNAQTAYDLARTSVQAFVSAGRTSGQRSDAGELRDDLMDALTVHMRRTVETYDKFVVENQEKFFGAIGQKVHEELLEPGVWYKVFSDLQGYDLESKVRAWQFHATNYFGVDLGALSSDARERLKKELRYVIEDLVDGHRAAEKSYREVADVVKNKRKELENDLGD